MYTCHKKPPYPLPLGAGSDWMGNGMESGTDNGNEKWAGKEHKMMES